MKGRSTLLFLTGVFLALLVLTLLQGAPAAPRPALPDSPPVATAGAAQSQSLLDSPARIFTGFAPAQMQAFSILDPDTGATLSLLRDGDLWTALEFDRPADPAAAEALAFTMAVLPALETLAEVPPADYAGYGLTEADAFLLLSVLLRDNTRHVALIGDVTPDGLGHYALVDDRPQVVVVDARPIAFIVSYLRQVYLPPTATATPAP
ncbi:MAG: hypothetical protein MUE40_04215 [Anaerolineae bacterium]|jgi:hypothetical protein|nr:hypothetical protein [Anaerolineae bacterium]